MCGRYGRRSDKQKIAEAFHVKKSLSEIDILPNDDITPGTMQPVVFSNEEGERDIELMYWGFTFPKRLTFNTRSDTILKPGLWKNLFEDRRCIVPADCFFEWKRLHKKNNPKYEITIKGRHPFGLAGIWSMWKNKAGDSLPTVSVITSEPNEAMTSSLGSVVTMASQEYKAATKKLMAHCRERGFRPVAKKYYFGPRPRKYLSILESIAAKVSRNDTMNV